MPPNCIWIYSKINGINKELFYYCISRENENFQRIPHFCNVRTLTRNPLVGSHSIGSSNRKPVSFIEVLFRTKSACVHKFIALFYFSLAASIRQSEQPFIFIATKNYLFGAGMFVTHLVQICFPLTWNRFVHLKLVRLCFCSSNTSILCHFLNDCRDIVAV